MPSVCHSHSHVLHVENKYIRVEVIDPGKAKSSLREHQGTPKDQVEDKTRHDHPEQRGWGGETATVEKYPEANSKRMTFAEITNLLSAFFVSPLIRDQRLRRKNNFTCGWRYIDANLE